MKLGPRQRWTGLLLALAATLAATFAIDDEAPEDDRPARHARRDGATAAASTAARGRAATIADATMTAPPSAEGRAGAAAASGDAAASDGVASDESAPPLDAFRTKSWQPPPPPPAKPGAPPLPFRYLGKVVDDGAARFFVARQDSYLTLREGDRIDDQYLFERAERGRLVFLYQPLQQRQFLAVTAD